MSTNLMALGEKPSIDFVCWLYCTVVGSYPIEKRGAQQSRGFPGGSEVKASVCNAGHLGLIPRSGRSPGEGNGNPFQYSCLENPMERGA